MPRSIWTAGSWAPARASPGCTAASWSSPASIGSRWSARAGAASSGRSRSRRAARKSCRSSSTRATSSLRLTTKRAFPERPSPARGARFLWREGSRLRRGRARVARRLVGVGRGPGHDAEQNDVVPRLEASLGQRFPLARRGGEEIIDPAERGPDLVRPAQRARRRARGRRTRPRAADGARLRLHEVVAAEEFLAREPVRGKDPAERREGDLLLAGLDPRELALAHPRLGGELAQGLAPLLADPAQGLSHLGEHRRLHGGGIYSRESPFGNVKSIGMSTLQTNIGCRPREFRNL